MKQKTNNRENDPKGLELRLLGAILTANEESDTAKVHKLTLAGFSAGEIMKILNMDSARVYTYLKRGSKNGKKKGKLG